jgi:hypothetical protein
MAPALSRLPPKKARADGARSIAEDVRAAVAGHEVAVLRCDDGETIGVAVRHRAAAPLNFVFRHREQQPRLSRDECGGWKEVEASGPLRPANPILERLVRVDHHSAQFALLVVGINVDGISLRCRPIRARERHDFIAGLASLIIELVIRFPHAQLDQLYEEVIGARIDAIGLSE